MESTNHFDSCKPDVVMANLDRCTDGDIEFRKELAQLLANNMTELMANIQKAVSVIDANILMRSVHKTKTTLSILNDTEMNEGISIVQTKLKESTSEGLEGHVEKLISRCQKTIEILTSLSAA